jgi:hypothetical protein
MNTKKQIFKKAVAFFAIVATLLIGGCSKSDSNGDNNSEDTYTVPVTMTLAGETVTSTISVYKGVGNFNCNTIAMQATADSPQFSFGINYFAKEGSTIDGPRNACDKTTIQAGKGLVANRYDCYSKATSQGTLSLSGKTYTLTCNVYADRNANDTAAGNIEKTYVLTATWTRP